MIDQDTSRALIAAVRAAAREEILPRFRNLTPQDVASKSRPDDLVTEADKRAEHHMTRAFERILPGAVVLGEEAIAEDPARARDIHEAEHCVIIDPVDGTWNFAHGISSFGSMVAIAHRGDPVWGLLYDPLADDWIWASRGQGAWYGLPTGVRSLHPATPSGAFASLWNYPEPKRGPINALLSRQGRVMSLGCSCHEYRGVISGNFSMLLSSSPQPWDHFAGQAIIEEIGGRVLDTSLHRYSGLPSLPVVAGLDPGIVEETAHGVGEILAV